MRLREPLYGARVASMHLVIHFCLLVDMVLIDFGIFDKIESLEAASETKDITPTPSDSKETLFSNPSINNTLL